MGKAWEAKKGAGKPVGRSSGSAYWDYWPGSWHGQRPQGRGYDAWYPPESEAAGPAFPAYDSKDRAAAVRKEAQKGWGKGGQAMDLDPQDRMTTELQEHINQTRKAEQKVRSIAAARDNKEKMWTKYQDDMKQSLAKEYARYQKAMETIDKDLAAATSAREEARQNLRQCWQHGLMTGPADGDNDGGDHWGQVMEGWRQEQQEAEASHAVLHRAFQHATAGGPPEATLKGSGGLMTQEAAARLFAAAMTGQLIPAVPQMPPGVPGEAAMPRAHPREPTYMQTSPPPAAPFPPVQADNVRGLPANGAGAPGLDPSKHTPQRPRPKGPQQVHSGLPPRQPVKPSGPGSVAHPASPGGPSLQERLEAKRDALRAGQEKEKEEVAATEHASVPAKVPEYSLIDDDTEADNMEQDTAVSLERSISDTVPGDGAPSPGLRTME
eukprot:s9_g14.t1